MPSSKFTYFPPSGATRHVVKEEQIEYGFIGKLQGLKYEHRPDIRDRAALERNFREKFEALNRVKLRLLPQLGQDLSAEFGRGFDATNLRHMRGFYLAFPIRDALRRELSWTHSPSLSAIRRKLRQVRTDANHEAAT